MRNLMLVAAIMICGCETPAEPEVTADELRALEVEVASVKSDLTSQLEVLKAQLAGAEASRTSLEAQLKALNVEPPTGLEVSYISGPEPESDDPPWTAEDAPTNVQDALNVLLPFVTWLEGRATNNEQKRKTLQKNLDAVEKDLATTDGRVDAIDPSLLVCPDGMIDIEGRFCIDDESREPTALLNARGECSDAGWTICTYTQYVCGAVLQSSEFKVAHLVDDFAGPDSTVVFRHGTMLPPINEWEAAAYRCCVGYADLVYRKVD